MIISRTPTRISFFGGGTDYPDWFKDNEGSVISTTINKYSYITVRNLPPFFDYKHRIRYFENEEVHDVSDIKHPSVRECLKFLSINNGIEVVHNADLPARSGLGSSSTFTVGMLNALYAHQKYLPTKRELAVNAIEIEQNRIKESVGSQDQIAASFGGLNYIKFAQSGNFEVNPILLNDNRLHDLQSHLLLCFTGFSRTASEIAVKQINKIKENKRVLKDISSLTSEALIALTQDKTDIRIFGELLNNQWRLKRELDESVTNDYIDSLYKRGIDAGATGGKLLGAGAGGFFLFFAEPKFHQKIIDSLKDNMFVPFRFDTTGSTIVYYSND